MAALAVGVMVLFILGIVGLLVILWLDGEV